MKQIKVFCMAMLAMLAVACNPFKTVATVDVTVVDQDNKPVAGVTVGRFETVGQTEFLANADERATTNAGGVAHFELKALEDLPPIESGDTEGDDFVFRAFDKDNAACTEAKSIYVRAGDKATLTLTILPPDTTDIWDW